MEANKNAEPKPIAIEESMILEWLGKLCKQEPVGRFTLAKANRLIARIVQEHGMEESIVKDFAATLAKYPLANYSALRQWSSHSKRGALRVPFESAEEAVTREYDL